MASNATISMSLVANTNRFVSRLAQARREIKKLSKRASLGGIALRTMGKLAGSAGVAIGGLASAAVAARAIFSLTKRAEGFNAAMLNSLAIIDDVSDAMKNKMARAAFDAAAATKFSSAQVAKSFFDLFSANLDVNQALAALPTVAKFAQAGQFDLSVATDLLTDAQTAMGLAVKDASQNLINMNRVADVLVKANKIATATTEQFSIALTTKAASAARFFNVSLEETVATLAIFARAGIKDAKAGTALDIVLRELTGKAIENRKAFAALNIEVFKAGQFRGIANVIKSIEDALKGMTPELKKATIMQLGFTAKSFSALRALIGFSSELRAATAVLEEAGGTFEKVSKEQMTPMARAIAKIESRWTELGKTFATSDRLASSVDVVAKAIERLNAGMRVMLDKSKELVPIGIKLSALYGGMAITAGSLAAVLPLVWKGMKAITLALKGTAIGLAIVQALSGPKGWLILAGSVAVATSAVVAINFAMKSSAKEMAIINAETKAMADAAKAAADSVGNLATSQKDLLAASKQLNNQPAVMAGANNQQDRLKGIKRILEALKKQSEMFGLNARAATMWSLRLLGADKAAIALVKSLFANMDKLKGWKDSIRVAAEEEEFFASTLDDLKAQINDFDLSPAEQAVNSFVREFKKISAAAGLPFLVSRDWLKQIAQATTQLQAMRTAANAFADLKQQALALFRATRTPQENFNDEMARLIKLSTTIDPATNKPLIDTDTLNRGLAKAKDLLRSIKSSVDGFISGKREFIGGVIGAVSARIAATKKGKRQAGNIFQFAPPNLFGAPGGPGRSAGGRLQAVPGKVFGSSGGQNSGKVDLAQNAQLGRIEILLQSLLIAGRMTRVN